MTTGVLVAILAVSQFVVAVLPASAVASDYHPLTTLVAVAKPTGMATAAGKIYVSDGNTVQVFNASTKALVGTLTGMFGATSPVASADGSLVYVAEKTGSVITAISTATDTVAASGDTSDCPHSLSVTSTTVWYLVGCDAPYSVNTLPAVTLAGPATVVPAVTTNSDSRTALRVEDSTLALVKSSSIEIYAVDGSDALTPGATLNPQSTDGDIAIHGNSLFLADTTNYDYRRFNMLTGSLTGSYSAETFPKALAVSPDGSQLGLGVNAPYDDGLWVFDAAAGVASVRGSVDVGQSTFAGVTDVAFSTNGSRLYALAKLWNATSASDDYYLVTSTTSTPAATDVTLSVTSPAQYGKPLVADAEVMAGGDPVADETVTFVVDSNGSTRTVQEQTGSDGVAHLSLSVKYSGQVKAKVGGDVDRVGTTTAFTPYQAASKFSIVMSKAVSVRHGVHYYKSVNDIAAAATLSRSRLTALVHGLIQVKKADGWHTMSTEALYTDTRSVVGLHMTTAKSRTVYRFGFVFDGDSMGGKVTSYTPSFALK